MKKNIGKIIAGLIAVIVLAFIFMRGNQLREFIETIEKGAPLFLAAALVFQVAKYFAQAAAFYWCFRATDSKLPFKECLKLVFKTYFIDTVIPSLNISEITLTVEEAGKFGVGEGKATGASLLRQVSITAAFAIIMLIGLAIIAIAGKTNAIWIASGIVAVLCTAILIAGMVLAALYPKKVSELAAPLERVADKALGHFHKNPVDGQVKKFIYSYASAAQLIGHNKGCIALNLAWAVFADILEAICFALIGYAFGLHNIEAIICVYIVATLLATLSPTPQGVGVVEAACLLAFTLFSVNQATGMAIIMVFRTVMFWLPFLIGAIMMQGNSMLNDRKKKQDADKGVAK